MYSERQNKVKGQRVEIFVRLSYDVGRREVIDLTTIHDVARKAGVSISTVSRVLNNSELVVPEKRKRVLDAIEELNYQPNGLARGLIHKRTQTIGALIPDVSNFFFAEVFRGMEDVAHTRGWNVIICNTDGDPKRMLNYIDVLREKRVDGIVFTSEPVSKEYYDAMLRLSVPVVLAATQSDFGIPAVKVHDEKASYDAVRFLIDQGHCHIRMIAGTQDDPIAGKPRVRGFYSALEEAGLPVDESFIYYGNYRLDSGKQGAAHLLRAHPETTALFAASDEMALGVYGYAYEQGLRIPDDLSVMGFDNVRIAQMATPALTTAAQPLYEIGAESVNMLIDAINGKALDKEPKYLAHTVKIRGSVKTHKNNFLGLTE